MANYNSRLQMKNDTAENWAKAINFIPLKGEMIIYTDLNQIKIGDGVTNVNGLPFSGTQSDWQQNDENAADYVKNRPGGYDDLTEGEIIVKGEVRLGGNLIEGLSATKYENEKVVEIITEVGKSYKVSLGWVEGIGTTQIFNTENTSSDFFSRNGEIIISNAPFKTFFNEETGEFEFESYNPNDFVYFPKRGEAYSGWELIGSSDYSTGYVKEMILSPVKIPERYIELPEQAKPDWQENNNNSPSYISNRPGAYTIYGEEIEIINDSINYISEEKENYNTAINGRLSDWYDTVEIKENQLYKIFFKNKEYEVYATKYCPEDAPTVDDRFYLNKIVFCNGYDFHTGQINFIDNRFYFFPYNGYLGINVEFEGEYSEGDIFTLTHVNTTNVEFPKQYVPNPDWQENNRNSINYIENRPGGYDALREELIFNPSYLSVNGSTWNTEPYTGELDETKEYRLCINAGMGNNFKSKPQKVNNELVLSNVDLSNGIPTLGYEDIIYYPSLGKFTAGHSYYDNYDGPVVELYIQEVGPVKIPQKYLDLPETKQVDWNQTDATSADFIKNKPVIPEVKQPDWNQTNQEEIDFIKNKPEIVQADWSQTNSSAADYIKNKPEIVKTPDWTQNNVNGDGYIKNRPGAYDDENGEPVKISSKYLDIPLEVVISDTAPVDGSLWVDTSDLSDFNDLEVAYTHAMNKGSSYANGLYKIATNGEGHVIAAQAVQKADIVALGIPEENSIDVEISDAIPTNNVPLWLDTSEEVGSTSDRINVAYQHAEDKGEAFTSGFYKITTNSEGHIIAAEPVTKADIVALGIPGEGAVYENATQTADGLMSSTDKVRLDEIPTPTSADTGKALQVDENGDYYLGEVAPEYADATQEASGLMSAADKIKVDALEDTYQTKITFSDQDIVAGETELAPGEVYFVYE